MHPSDPIIPEANPTAWQPLPRQARLAFIGSGVLSGLPLALGGRLLDSIFELPGHWIWMLAGAGFGAALGAVWGLRRYLYTCWRLQATSLDLRRGRLWQSEVLVPINRVQHLDLLRGPLDRRLGLASLVVHTAGSRRNTVTLDGLAEADAARLRDVLARQAGLAAPASTTAISHGDDANGQAAPGDGIANQRPVHEQP